MRLNDKTYPALKYLQDGNPAMVPMDEAFFTEKDSIFDVTSLGETCVDMYKQVSNRYYLTKPFLEAVYKAAPKIVDDRKHLNNDKPDCGILFSGQNNFNIYLINPADKMCKMVLLGFNRECLVSISILTNEYKHFGRYWILKDGKPFDDSERCALWGHSTLIALYFIHHCEIDTTIVQPKQKHRQYGVKYFNESKSPFTILDCSWFTKLIRDTPFTVNGHFRWQPCGLNHSKRKLIWIDTFEKKGYTRNAKKETADAVHS